MNGVAVVTGGGRNLGRSIVLALARAGHDVVINTRTDLDAAESVAAEARAVGARAVCAPADVAIEEQVQQLFARADSLGPLRVVVNNASLRTRVDAYQATAADWQAVRGVTLDGAVHCVLSALPRLRSAGGGSIVSVLGGNSIAGDPGRFHLSTAKHGLIGMTKSLAAACAADRIAVNAVSPILMSVESGAPDADQEIERRRAAVADIVAYLASPAAADITGQLIDVGSIRQYR